MKPKGGAPRTESVLRTIAAHHDIHRRNKCQGLVRVCVVTATTEERRDPEEGPREAKGYPKVDPSMVNQGIRKNGLSF